MSVGIKVQAPMDVNQIKEILPQRYPFLMVDRVIEVIPSSKPDGFSGRKVVIQKNVSANEPYFNGHFPDYPLMPGVMQLEAMAQASALACWNDHCADMEMVIAGVRDARFRKPVVPGDILIVTSEVLRFRSKTGLFKCVAKVGDQVVSEAELLAALSPLGAKKV